MQLSNPSQAGPLARIPGTAGYRGLSVSLFRGEYSCAPVPGWVAGRGRLSPPRVTGGTSLIPLLLYLWGTLLPLAHLEASHTL